MRLPALSSILVISETATASFLTMALSTDALACFAELSCDTVKYQNNAKARHAKASAIINRGFQTHEKPPAPVTTRARHPVGCAPALTVKKTRQLRRPRTASRFHERQDMLVASKAREAGNLPLGLARRFPVLRHVLLRGEPAPPDQPEP